MVGLYLEDSLPENVLRDMEEWKNKYSTEDFEKTLTEVYDNIFKRRVVELTTTLEQLEQKELVENK